VVHGYYLVRILDNVMDGEGRTEIGLLPAAKYLQHELERPFGRLFPAEHGFWSDFERYLRASVDATVLDHLGEATDEESFRETAGLKIIASMIPVAAVAHLAGRADVLDDWQRLIECYGCWHQMHNDLFDWARDHEHGVATFFLQEASSRRRPAEPVGAWVAREGFELGLERAQRWLGETRRVARRIGSAPIEALLAARATEIAARAEELRPGLRDLCRLGTILSGELPR